MNINSAFRFVTSTRVLVARSMSLLTNKAYVNGEWVVGATGKTFEVKNPVDGSVVECVPDMDVCDAERAIDSAVEAMQEWQQKTAKERGLLLRCWHDLLGKNCDELAEILTAESGKPLNEARAEVAYGNSFVEWFSEEARRVYGEVLCSPYKNRYMTLTRQPIGVVGLITPWNFPHAMVTRKAAAALAAGCTCVLRPAEDTPLTALAIVKLADEAGIPKGVINVVTSARANAGTIGKLLCEHHAISGISFTGSTAVGKLLFRQCAGGLKRLALELGGNAPFIVFETANIDKAVQGAIAAKFRNCGQTCIAANRLFVQESICEEFVEKFTEAVKEQVIIGDGMKEGVTAGPLINSAQLTKVCCIVQDAVTKGATVLVGGNRATDLGELFYEPTVLVNVNESMRIYNEEIFGPVAPIIKFSTEEEALCIANCTNSGLAGYFYSNDPSQIYRVASLLSVGMVGVNESMISACEAAFGGVKESGVGREGSRHGIDDFTYMKYTCVGNLC